MGSISRVRADHFTNDDRVLRDKLVIGEDEAACAAIIEQGIREVQDRTLGQMAIVGNVLAIEQRGTIRSLRFRKVSTG